MEHVVGIDFGSRSCVVSFTRGNCFESCVDDNGYSEIPSCFCMEKGKIKVGSAAYKRRKSIPVIQNFKELIGVRYSDISHEKDVESFGVEVIEGDDGYCCFSFDKSVFSIMNVVSLLFKYIKKWTEQLVGKEVTTVGISIPSEYSLYQRKCIEDAAVNAGWTKVQLICDPVAAIIGTELDISANETVMVFDYGSSSLTVSILRKVEQQYQILSSFRDVLLGGGAIDDAISHYVQNEYETSTGMSFWSGNQKKQKREKIETLEEIQQTKRRLSFADDAVFSVDRMESVYTSRINQDTLKSCINPILNRVKKVVNYVMEHSSEQITSQDIKKVVLVGGNSSFKVFKDFLSTMFPSSSIIGSFGDTLSKGCAMCLKQQIIPDYQTIKHLNTTIGIELNDGMIYPIFERGQMIPASKDLTLSSSGSGEESFQTRIVEIKGMDQEHLYIIADLQSKNVVVAPDERKEYLFTFTVEENGTLRVVCRTYPGYEECLNTVILTLSH